HAAGRSGGAASGRGATSGSASLRAFRARRAAHPTRFRRGGGRAGGRARGGPLRSGARPLRAHGRGGGRPRRGGDDRASRRDGRSLLDPGRGACCAGGSGGRAGREARGGRGLAAGGRGADLARASRADRLGGRARARGDDHPRARGEAGQGAGAKGSLTFFRGSPLSPRMASDRASLPKAYEPSEGESRRYSFWKERGYFAAQDVSDKPPYCIVIPPPNITGSLHMGHAVFVTLQDILIRWKRMSGYNALWLPGTDHAGIATQMIVERELLAKEGLSRHDLGREKFLERVWAWKAKYGSRITEQFQVLGASLDWARERFTLDEGLSRAVREAFVRLWEEGLIYRANRLINWCPKDRTALSDLEVDHEEGAQGELFEFAYPLSDGSGEIVVATTRPETMLGDTAVAVHPDDERYRHLIGKT